MDALDEHKMRLFTLMGMANTLKNYLSSEHAEDRLQMLLEVYRRIYELLISIDPGAADFVQEPASIVDIEQLRVAVECLLAYIIPKVIPVSFQLIHTLKDLGLIQIYNPMQVLNPIMSELGLSVNWAVGALALTLIEIVVNKKLKELGLDTEGSFDKKVRRISEFARKFGVNVPDLLARPFYDARSKVIHWGVEPTSEELELIISYLRSLMMSLKKLCDKVKLS